MIIDYIIVEMIVEEGCPLYEVQKNMEEQGYLEVWVGFLKEVCNKAMQEIVLEVIWEKFK